MFEAVVEALPERLRTAPERLRAAPEQLRAAPQRIRERGEQLQEDLQERVRRMEGEGRERLWRVQTRTLERAEELLERVDELPVVKLVAEPVERLVQERLEQVVAPPQGYEQMNAKTAIKTIKHLDRVGVRCVDRHETRNKARKTVLAAVAQRLETLEA